MRPLLCFFSLLAASLSLGADFSGSYKGTQDEAEFNLDLTQTGTSLTGTAKVSIVEFKFTGTVSGENAEGDVSVLTEKLKFKAKLTTDGLEMKIAELDEAGKADWTGADTINFKRVGEAAKTEEPKTPGKLAKFVKEPTELLKSGKEYTHANGGKMRYPANWKLEETELGLRLTPPDATENELYLITSEPANGATDPGAPEVLAYLDETLKASLPDMKRVGKVEKASAGNGKGVFITWEGTANGKPAQVRAYAAILKGNGVALIAIGSKDVLEKRDKALRDIFYTFGWGQGQKDQKLVGNWKHWSYNATAGRETNSTATLAADGTFSYQSNSETNANFSGKNQYGDITWTGGLSSRGGSGWRGTWTASGGELILNFEDGTREVFNYAFKQEGANVFLVTWGDDRKKALEWSRAGESRRH
ncbi:MAG: hypothetical protein ABL949_04925 [Fimbriimonadaceae bacterium]